MPARLPACTMAVHISCLLHGSTHCTEDSLCPTMAGTPPQGITSGAVLTVVRRVLVADGWKVRRWWCSTCMTAAC